MPNLKEYDIELQKYAKVTKLGKLKLTPRVVRFANFVGKSTLFRIRKDRDLVEKKHQISGYQDTPLKIISYSPETKNNILPAILFFHGGAFLLGGFGHSRKLARNYAKNVNAIVFFVEYHLAYKYPYPYALEDAYLSLKWLHDNHQTLGINPNAIAVLGDSAGGYIAAALSHLSKERNGPNIAYQMLIYPVIDSSAATKSMDTFQDTPVWNSRLNKQMCEIYFKDPKELHPYTKLLSMNCSGLPPAYIEAHEFDCLRDEAIEYADRLSEHDVPVQFRMINGSFHGADIFSKTTLVQALLNDRYSHLKTALHPTEEGDLGDE